MVEFLLGPLLENPHRMGHRLRSQLEVGAGCTLRSLKDNSSTPATLVACPTRYVRTQKELRDDISRIPKVTLPDDLDACQRRRRAGATSERVEEILRNDAGPG